MNPKKAWLISLTQRFTVHYSIVVFTKDILEILVGMLYSTLRSYSSFRLFKGTGSFVFGKRQGKNK